MKFGKIIVIGAMLVAAGTGALLLTRPAPEPERHKPVIAEIPVAAPEPERHKPVIAEILVAAPEPIEEPAPIPPPPPAPEKTPEPVEEKPVQHIVVRAQPAPPVQIPEKIKIERHKQYSEQVSARFKAKIDLLAQETDPQKRLLLIQQIAPYVRMDTLATLDWVSNLETPEEQRTALEAINQNALVGIGARIEQDESGMVKIRETTILSAVGSSGKVENGDYIAGVVNEDGSTVNFKGMSMQEVVKYLRGKPGTEVQLLMETPDAEPYSVSINRSMIVMEPLF